MARPLRLAAGRPLAVARRLRLDDGRGAALLYESHDLENWAYQGTGQTLTLRFCPTGDMPWRIQTRGDVDYTLEAWELLPGFPNTPRHT